MTKRKGGIHNLISSVGESAEPGARPKQPGPTSTEPRSETPSRRFKGHAEQSPMGAVGKRAQRYQLELPVTEQSVECSLIEVDPDECFVSPYNKRWQSLLSIDDPENKALFQAIRSERQRDPVLIRPGKTNNPKHKYEIIYGSRRRFTVSKIKELHDPGIKLKAWFSNKIPDVDAKKLSHAENEERKPISAWEESMHLKALIDSGKYDRSMLIAELGISKSKLSRLLTLSEIPEDVMALLASPNMLAERSGGKIVNMLKAIEGKEKEEILSRVKEQAPYKSTAGLEGAFKEALNHFHPKPVLGVNKKIQITGSNGAVITINRHRTEADSYRASLKGIDQEKFDEIVALLKKHLS